MTAEIAARALGAAGVGTLRLVRRAGGLAADLAAAIGASNPDARVVAHVWPATGQEWLAALAGCDAIVRSGFDDDAMLRAAVRLGVPVVVARARPEAVDVVSFRRHGPCPHTPLDVPPARGAPADQGAVAVVAGQLAAAEILLVLADARPDGPRARHTRLSLDGGEPTGTSADLPWAPECFACGGAGGEMVFPAARPGSDA